MTIPRLELTEDFNKKNDFIIFRYQTQGKKIPKTFQAKLRPGSTTFSKKRKLLSKKTHKHKKNKTRKHKKYRSLFNIF